MMNNPCGARRKRFGALDSCFGLVSPHQQSIPFPYLQAPRVIKLSSSMYAFSITMLHWGFSVFILVSLLVDHVWFVVDNVSDCHVSCHYCEHCSRICFCITQLSY